MKVGILIFSIIYLCSGIQSGYTGNNPYQIGKELPLFADSARFTNDWLQNKSIKTYYARLKDNNDYDLIECYYTLSSDNKLTFNSSSKKGNLEEFYKAFSKYNWQGNKKFEYYNCRPNVKLTIEINANKRTIKMKIDVLFKFSPKNFVLNYKTVYMHQEKFK